MRAYGIAALVTLLTVAIVAHAQLQAGWSEVSGRRSHLARLHRVKDDRVHLSFWWTREHCGRRLHRWAAST